MKYGLIDRGKVTLQEREISLENNIKIIIAYYSKY